MTAEQRTEYMRTYRKEHREQINDTRREWRQTHPEQNRAINRRAAAVHRMNAAREYWRNMKGAEE